MSETTVNDTNGKAKSLTESTLDEGAAPVATVSVAVTKDAEKPPKKPRTKKLTTNFKVLKQGTLEEAISARPNARWLKKITSWNYRFFSHDQRDLISKSADKMINIKELEEVIIPMYQFLNTLTMHGQQHIGIMFQNLKNTDEAIYQLVHEWYTKTYQQHITDIVEKGVPFRFPFLVHVLNRQAYGAALNVYDDTPVMDTDLPIMFLGHARPGDFRQPVHFLNAQEHFNFFTGPTVVCATQTYMWQRGALRVHTGSVTIPAWDGEITLKDLGIQFSVRPEECSELTTLGKKVLKLVKEPSYVFCDSTMETVSSWAKRKIPARGRAMIDADGMALVNEGGSSDPSAYGYNKKHEENNAVSQENFTAVKYAMIDPYVYGFSFVTKQWGKFHVATLQEIEFRTNAFEQLVMEEDDKKLILSLVENVDPSKVTDFIDGKGGGCAFLFHGLPGLGKTLTAEAVADTVKRPLYAASVGELGTNVEALEKNLQKILQLAARWNAVLLLDEADIFLEERARGDIHRNAMVGTFLRLLEYYNGILILTSNRVKAIDQAFYSRISFAKKYYPHTTDTREQIIRNLLKVNGIELEDDAIKMLADHDVNGRQLKNSIRLARFLAESEKRKITGADVSDILGRVQLFAKELKDEATAAGQGDF